MPKPKHAMSAAAAKRPRHTYPMRRCHNCNTLQRAAAFRELHAQVHMACADCYHRARYSVDTATLRDVRRAFARYRSSAKQRGLSFTLKLRDVAMLWQKPCRYCLATIATIGIDRLDNAKGYTAANSVPCCTACNSNKGVLNVDCWLTPEDH